MTLNEHIAVFPDASEALKVTVVVPIRYKSPESWSEVRVTVLELSVAVGGVHATIDEFPEVTFTLKFSGQPVMFGASESIVTHQNKH